MKKALPFILVGVVALVVTVVAVYIYTDDARLEAQRPSFPLVNAAQPASVEQVIRESGDPPPEGFILSSPSPDAPVPQTMRGYFEAYENGVLTVRTDTGTLSATTAADVFSVCTGRYWYDTAGGRHDLTKVWFDTSLITPENYRQVGVSEVEIAFAEALGVFNPEVQLIIYGWEEAAGQGLTARKIWIFEDCP